MPCIFYGVKKLLACFCIAALALLAAVVVAGCASSGSRADFGTLAGEVTVGPLTPVERAGVTPPVPDPAVFTSRKLLLYDADGKTLLQTIDITPAGYYGTYNVTLEPGNYRLGYNYMGSARLLPDAITVEASRTTTRDVDIDTGIR